VQVGAIEARINDPNPLNRQALINDLKAGKGELVEGLPPSLRNQMLTAAEARNRELTNLAEVQDVNAKFNNLLGYLNDHATMFPNPESKLAATANPEILKAIGAVTPQGQPDYVAGEKLRGLMSPLVADEKTAAKTKADKEFDDVSKLIAENKLSEAQVELDKYRPDFEALDANYYRAGEAAIRNEINFQEQQARFERGEKRAARQEERWEVEEKGKQSFRGLMQTVASGKPIDFQKDIAPLLISGDITPTQVRQAIALSTLAQKDEGVRSGLKLIQSAAQFSAGTDTTNLEMAELGMAYTKTVQQQGYKGKDAIELAASMRDEAAKKTVKDAINDAFKWRPGTPPQDEGGWFSRLTQSVGRALAPAAETPAPATRTYQGYEYTKGDDGKWHRGRKVD